MEYLADLLDTKFVGPFGWRFGLDGILGLIPGVGDLCTNVLASYIILRAAILGHPFSVISRMIFNLLLENLLDALPILGNLSDFYIKTNQKNVALLKSYHDSPDRVRKKSDWIVISLFILVFFTLIIIMGLSIAFSYFLVKWLIGFI